MPRSPPRRRREEHDVCGRSKEQIGTRAAGPIRRRRRPSPRPGRRCRDPWPRRSTADRAWPRRPCRRPSAPASGPQAWSPPSAARRQPARAPNRAPAANGASRGRMPADRGATLPARRTTAFLSVRLGRADDREPHHVDHVAGGQLERLLGLDQRRAGLVADVDPMTHFPGPRVHRDVFDEDRLPDSRGRDGSAQPDAAVELIHRVMGVEAGDRADREATRGQGRSCR